MPSIFLCLSSFQQHLSFSAMAWQGLLFNMEKYKGLPVSERPTGSRQLVVSSV
jgi:hypothetical protein